MDEFLRDIHTSIFKQWVLMYKEKSCHTYLDMNNHNMIHIESEFYDGEIIFNALSIIEFSVINKVTHGVEFYLHFQMNTMKHALDLFFEMTECIQTLIHTPTFKVLLSCSGGLTTSYFASQINDAFSLLHIPYEASAVAYTKLFDVGADYDMILLAPQISYLHAKVQEILKEKMVIQIPPAVFAKYDVGAIITLIKKEIEKSKQQREKELHPQTFTLHKSLNSHKHVLVLSIIRNSNRVHIHYRLYGTNQEMILYNEIIKQKISIQDIYDVIDTVLTKYPYIENIGVSTPGIINQGFVTSANINGIVDDNLVSLLASRYHQNIVLGNDVNTAAIGYYMTQSQYSNIVGLFQPSHYCSGAGIIINGELLLGQHNLAGEVQYLPMDLSDDRLVLCKTPEGALELVAKTITSIISLISPEVIVLFCEMVPDVEELNLEIQKYIPKEYIPPIIKLDHLEEYTLLGQMVLCIQQEKS